jgi:uncharacterized protein (TIGR02284 family)
MNNPRTGSALISLYKIVEAGELGYKVVASNARNRALKVLFQTFSQQRHDFKEQLLAEMERLGGQNKPGSSILGMIHRGRIDIFATLTIGDENVEKVLLKEVLLGESVALRAYERTLNQDLPDETRALVERQFREVRKAVDQIQLLRGENGKRQVLRLYDSRADAEQAFQSLKKAGIAEEAIKIEDFQPPVIEPNKGRGTTVLETLISGAVGGGIWGLAAGILAAIGILQIAALNQKEPALIVLILSFIGLVVAGGFVGGAIGLFIGWSVASQDNYVSEALKHGEVLVRALIDESLASKAWRIMNQVALAARAHHAGEYPA